MVLFFPMGGLANRMRAIDSAVNFCELHKCRLNIYWIKDSGLNCDFKEIWSSVTFIRDIKGLIPGLLFNMYRRFFIFRYLLKFGERLRIVKVIVDQYNGGKEEIYNFVNSENNIPRYLLLIIKTCEDFCPSRKFRSDIFHLVPEISERVRKETIGFNENTIGVHIRRKDNIHSIENSPLELFEKQMSDELMKCEEVSFYIASDDQKIKDYFINGSHLKGPIFLSGGKLDRNSKAGIIQSVVELYALSHTKKIIGSYWSSYSAIASMIGSNELLIIKNNSL